MSSVLLTKLLANTFSKARLTTEYKAKFPFVAAAMRGVRRA